MIGPALCRRPLQAPRWPVAAAALLLAWAQAPAALAALSAAPAADSQRGPAGAQTPEDMTSVGGPFNGALTALIEADPVVAARERRDRCAGLLAVPWPRLSSDRRQLLQRFEAARPGCMGHAPFLAALGALWLEEGEPAQALLWIERSLLLEPQQLGAQADYALALAALGDTSARDELAARWRQRVDIPPALRERLALKLVNRAPLDSAEPQPVRQQWLVYRELMLVRGHETNLDHSPRLSEITLTLPDGSIELPLFEPIVPRRGAATVVDLSLQLARLTQTGWIWQTGLLASARHAESQRDTDWHHVQWSGSVSRRWGPWRGQAQISTTAVTGASDERYRLARGALTVEREAQGCTQRLAIEYEARNHEITPRTNGRTQGLLLGNQCALPAAADWSWGLAVRAAVDSPTDSERPGGTQRQVSAGLRLAGALPASFRLEAAFRRTRVLDAEGYSPLLAGGARRLIEQNSISLELSRPLRAGAGNGAEWVLQAQRTVQQSNLSIFAYQGTTLYGGLRLRW